MTRTEAYLIFNALRLVGPVKVRKLREVFGEVEKLCGMPTEKWRGSMGWGKPWRNRFVAGKRVLI